jgi:TetR/AcrR family transcriptional regulator
MSETRDKIFESAREVFIQKGFAGARMQEIADFAGINKGLLHYYFKTKDILFNEVVSMTVETLAPQLQNLVTSEDRLLDKIRQFVYFYIDTLIQNPFLPSFILHEINFRGDEFAKEIIGRYKINPIKLIWQIELETREGYIRPVNPIQMLLNILSMCIFPFVAKPMIQQAIGMSQEDFMRLMDYRKEEVTRFIIDAIKQKDYPNS